MGMQDARGKISKSYSDLLKLWFNVVRPQWQDKNAEEMEKMLLEMEREVKDTAAAMDLMAGLLNTVKKECGDE